MSLERFYKAVTVYERVVLVGLDLAYRAFYARSKLLKARYARAE
jgi:hypothetical protein